MNSPDWLPIGVIVRPRGRSGEVLLDRSLSRSYSTPLPALVGAATHTIESLWIHHDRAVLKFQGVDSIEAAEALRGLPVSIPRSALGPLEPGEFLYQDLPGCRVIDDATGAPLGHVADWHENGPQILLELDSGLLIPCVPELCPAILPAERLIRVKLPEGLREL